MSYLNITQILGIYIYIISNIYGWKWCETNPHNGTFTKPCWTNQFFPKTSQILAPALLAWPHASHRVPDSEMSQDVERPYRDECCIIFKYGYIYIYIYIYVHTYQFFGVKKTWVPFQASSWKKSSDCGIKWGLSLRRMGNVINPNDSIHQIPESQWLAAS